MTNLTDIQKETWKLLDAARGKGRSDLVRDVLLPVAGFILLRWAFDSRREEAAVAAFDGDGGSFDSKDRWFEGPGEPKPTKGVFREYLYEMLSSAFDNGGNTEFNQKLDVLRSAWDPMQENEDLLFAAYSWVASQRVDTLTGREAFAQAFEHLLWQCAAGTRFAGEFLTPPAILDLLVSLADPKPLERLYDPCFGFGGILSSVARRISKAGGSLPLDEWEAIQSQSLYGMEIQPVAYIIGLARIILAGINRPNLQLGNTLERPQQVDSHAEGFDCIIANPPFGLRVPEEVSSHYPVRTSSGEDLFIQHIMTRLRPGGRAVVLVPEGVLLKSGSSAEIRKRLLTQFGVEGLISLPSGAFQPYTGIKTNVVVFRRCDPAEKVWFQIAVMKPEAMQTRRRQSFENPVIDASAEVERFKSRQPSETGWETSTEALAKRNYELVARRTGEEDLDSLLDRLADQVKGLRTAELQEVAEVFQGIKYKMRDVQDPKSQSGQGIPLVRVGDIEGGEVRLPPIRLKPSHHVSPDRRFLQVSDVLLSTSGTVGKVGSIREALTGAFASSGIAVIRARSDVHIPFLSSLFRTTPYKSWIEGHATGATIRHLGIRTLRSLRIPIPPLEQQRQLSRMMPENTSFDELLTLFTTGSRTGTREDIRNVEVLSELAGGLERASNDKLATTLASLSASFRQATERLLIQVKDRSQYAWVAEVSEILERLQQSFDIPNNANRLVFLEKLQTRVAGVSAIVPASNSSIRDQLDRLSLALLAVIDKESEEIRSLTEVSVWIHNPIIEIASQTELGLRLRNNSALALLDVKVASPPDKGVARFKHVDSGQDVSWAVAIEPKRTGKYHIKVSWSAVKVDGDAIDGEVTLPYEVTSLREVATIEDLGASPYITGSPIDRGDMLFGRQSILDAIRRQLNVESRGNVMILEGNRRMGKTSILKALQRKGAIPDVWIPVYCSLQSGEGAKNAAGLPTREVFHVIAGEIGRAMNYSCQPVQVGDIGTIPSGIRFEQALRTALSSHITEERPFESFEGLIRAWEEAIKPNRVLLMLDEFEKIQEGIESGVTSPQVPQNLRSLFQAHIDMAVILTGALRLRRMREDYWSALFGLGPHIQVGPLPKREALALVQRPVEGRLLYTDEAREEVVSVCACQPFLIQLLCNRIFDLCAQSGGDRTVSVSTVRSAAQGMVNMDDHFHTLWHQYVESDRQRFLLCLIDHLSKTPDRISLDLLISKLVEFKVPFQSEAQIGDDMKYLEELELVEKQGDSGFEKAYSLSIPLMSLWLNASVDFADVRNKAIREGNS